MLELDGGGGGVVKSVAIGVTNVVTVVLDCGRLCWGIVSVV